MFSPRHILSAICLSGVLAMWHSDSHACGLENGPAVGVVHTQDVQAKSDVDRLRFAIKAIHVPDDDAQRKLMESARDAALEELGRAQESPFVKAGTASMIPTLQRIEEDTQDFGAFAGQHWTEWLLRLIGTLQVRSTQCVTTAEAADSAIGVVRVVEELCAEFASTDTSKATMDTLRRGAAELAQRLKDGDIVVARRSLDNVGIDAFRVRLRQRVTELTSGEGTLSGQLVAETYQAEFQDDACKKDLRAKQTMWISENRDLIDGFAAAEKANAGRMDEEFMKNWSKRRAEAGPRDLQQKVNAAKAARVEGSEEAARLSCLLALAAAAVQVIPLDPVDGLPWQSLDCTLAWTPRDDTGKWFLATYGAIARRTHDGFEFRVGLVRSIGNEIRLPIDVAGASLSVNCGVSGGLEIGGLASTRCDEEWVNSSFHSLTCGAPSSVNEASPRLCGLRAIKYPLLEHGFAYGGVVLRVAAIPHDGLNGFEEDVISQCELIQVSRRFMHQVQQGEIDSGAKNAFKEVSQCAEGNSCATRILRAAVLRQIAALDSSAVPGGFASIHAALIELLSLPADSPLRDHLARTAPETLAPLPLDPDAAPLLWAALEVRQDCPQVMPAIVGALTKAFAAAGLPTVDAHEIVARVYVALRDKGIPNCAISDRWAISAVPLVSQANGAASLRDPASRLPAMHALEWMLLGAGERQFVGGESRRQAWNSALDPLRQEFEQLATEGQLDASSAANLRESGTRVLGGIRWRAGYPCFPPFNFDPDASWIGSCVTKSIQRAKGDLNRLVLGSMARWPSALTGEERQLAIGFLGCRIYETLVTEPEATTAPHGHGAVLLPIWAESFGLTVQDPSNPVLTVQRKR